MFLSLSAVTALHIRNIWVENDSLKFIKQQIWKLLISFNILVIFIQLKLYWHKYQWKSNKTSKQNFDEFQWKFVTSFCKNSNWYINFIIFICRYINEINIKTYKKTFSPHECMHKYTNMCIICKKRKLNRYK